MTFPFQLIPSITAAILIFIILLSRQRKQLQGGMDVQPDCFTAKHPKAASDHAPTEPKSPKSYFLIKSEADVFSIDDLASRPEQTEPWDGECVSFNTNVTLNGNRSRVFCLNYPHQYLRCEESPSEENSPANADWG